MYGQYDNNFKEFAGKVDKFKHFIYMRNESGKVNWKSDDSKS